MPVNSLDVKYRTPLIVAVSLHLLILIALSIKYHPVKRFHQMVHPQNVINAVAIKQADVDREAHRITEQLQEARLTEMQAQAKMQAEAKMAEQLLQAQKQAEEKLIANKQKAEALAEKKKLEVQKVEELAAKQKIAHEKLLSEKAEELRKKTEAEVKHQAEKKLAEEKKAAAEAEAKHQADIKLAEKKKAEEKKKQLAELEKQRREVIAKSLQDQMSEEQAQLAAEHTAIVQKEIVKYQDLILSAISHQWRVPANTQKNLSCRFLIQLGPGGVVLDVKLLQGSGDAILDRSARTAVFKASPLPIPKDPEIFNQFREFRLLVRPEIVM